MKLVKYEQSGQVGIITMNRPQALNALNHDMLEQLETCLDAVDLNETRCLILTGEGKAFVAGADIKEMLDFTPEQAHAFSQRGNRIFRKLETFPLPVIAAVNGFALGGGCELALSCDLRIASEKAQFGQPEVGLGIIPGFGGTQRLPRLVGMEKAKELLYTGDRMDAAQAAALGLVSAVCPAAELMTKAMTLALKICANTPFAVQACKKAIYEGSPLPMEKALEVEAQRFSQCFTTEDRRKAMEAFVSR